MRYKQIYSQCQFYHLHIDTATLVKFWLSARNKGDHFSEWMLCAGHVLRAFHALFH